MNYGCYSDYFLIYDMIYIIYDMVMVDMIDLTNSMHFYICSPLVTLGYPRGLCWDNALRWRHTALGKPTRPWASPQSPETWAPLFPPMKFVGQVLQVQLYVLDSAKYVKVKVKCADAHYCSVYLVGILAKWGIMYIHEMKWRWHYSGWIC